LKILKWTRFVYEKGLAKKVLCQIQKSCSICLNMSETKKKSGGILSAFLDIVEKLGNRLPDPLVLYFGLALLIPILSWLISFAGWSRVHPVSGETIHLISLLSVEQIQRMFVDAVDNFTGFPPLGAVLVTMLGIGVAERSGLISTSLKLLVKSTPKSLISVVVVFAGVMSSMAADAGYVVLTPLGAVLFAGMGRHPLAGLCAAFAGTGGGFSANLLLTSLDPLLSGFTQSASQLYDADRVVTADANYFFMIASVLVVTSAGWFVTERIVEPRLGKWDMDTEDIGSDSDKEREAQIQTISPVEQKGLFGALMAVVLMGAALLFLTIPEGAILRDAEGRLTPMVHGLVIIIMLLFIFPGLVYGLIVGSCRNSKQLAGMMSDTMATMGGYIVLAFAAAQFVAYFQWSNMGLLTALTGAEILAYLGVGDLPLILTFVFLAAGINLVIGSASAKWGIMAPVFVPMFMALGLSPEMTQAAYRVGDSITNMITPLNPYFPIVLSFAMRYDRKLGIGTLISSMVPYSIAFALGWTLLLVVWYFLGLHLGPGAGIQM
tara:strand:+ start:941 stop:2584 length:1644 start_codon:yes stop_codon:yes gene_type:complete